MCGLHPLHLTTDDCIRISHSHGRSFPWQEHSLREGGEGGWREGEREREREEEEGGGVEKSEYGEHKNWGEMW